MVGKERGKQRNMNYRKKLLTAGCVFALSLAFSTGEAFADTGSKAVEASQRTGVPVVGTSEASYANVAISQVSNYVNVRTEANTTSEVVGKIYNNCAATILSTVDGEGGKWYKIQSGTVSGYIKAEYFITGAEAEKIAKKVGTVYVTINTASLRLREEPNTTSRTLTLLSQDAEYIALKEEGDFVEIQVDAALDGYVHKDYLKQRVVFEQAVSLEEERQKLAETEKLKREAKEAIAALEKIKKEEPVGIIAANPEGGSIPQITAPGQSSSGNEAAGQGPSDQGSSGLFGSLVGGSLVTIVPEQGTSGSGTSSNGKGNGLKGNTILFGQNGPGMTTDSETSSDGTESSQSGTQSGPGSVALTSATRTAIIAYAKQFLGNPYVYGGTSLTNGADCSGFTMKVFENFGIDTGRTSRDQADKGKTIPLDSIQPGDLVFYANGDYINHVALYIGGGQIIHASTPKNGIMITTMNYRTPYKAVTFLN